MEKERGEEVEWKRRNRITVVAFKSRRSSVSSVRNIDVADDIKHCGDSVNKVSI